MPAPKYPTAAHYDRMKSGTEEAATAVLPISKDAMKARRRAIREGRLTVVPTPAPAEVAKPTKAQERAGVAAKLAAKGKRGAGEPEPEPEPEPLKRADG